MSCSNMNSSNFNKVLLDISSELSEDELDRLKFLVGNRIGKRDHERISSGRDLFRVLAERGHLAAADTDYLSGLLQDIHRPDLSDKLRLFSGHTELPEPPEPERARLDASTLVVSENVGRPWRRLGRRLGLSEAKLESIAGRHPSDLEETVVELLKEWRRSQGAQARTEDLVMALRACQFNLTADKVEDTLSALGL